jgi:hypothetical protein
MYVVYVHILYGNLLYLATTVVRKYHIGAFFHALCMVDLYLNTGNYYHIGTEIYM